jgi:hypothetical protein
VFQSNLFISFWGDFNLNLKHSDFVSFTFSELCGKSTIPFGHVHIYLNVHVSDV